MTTTTPAPYVLPSTLSQEEQDALKASIFQRLHPRVYLERFLAENVRPDGRTTNAWRNVSVNVGSISTADGSALVRLGNTTVVCGVKGEIAKPELDKEKDGFLVPNLDLPAMCSPKFKPGPPSEEAQVLSDRLNEVLVKSATIPLSSLCIHPGKAVWVLYVDAVCINYDGNVFDAALLAIVAALKNTQLPQAKYDEETGRTICSRASPRIPLDILRTPMSMSFGVFSSATLLSDPTSFEEPLLDTTISIIVDTSAGGALISTTQIGIDTSSEQNMLLTCTKAAEVRWPALAKTIVP